MTRKERWIWILEKIAGNKKKIGYLQEEVDALREHLIETQNILKKFIEESESKA